MQRLKFNKLLSHPRHGAHGMALTSGGRSQIQLSADVSLQSSILPPEHSRLRVMLCTPQVLRATLTTSNIPLCSVSPFFPPFPRHHTHHVGLSK